MSTLCDCSFTLACGAVLRGCALTPARGATLRDCAFTLASRTHLGNKPEGGDDPQQALETVVLVEMGML